MSIALAAGEAVKRCLIDQAMCAGIRIDLPAEQHRPWSGCSFRGGRHSFVLISHDALLSLAWLALLPLLPLRVPGFVVSDITVAWSQQACGMTMAAIDVLTIQDT